MRGDKAESVAVLVGVAAEDADTEEDSLVDDQDKEDWEEEAAVAAGGVEESDIFEDHRLHLDFSLFVAEATHLVAFEFDGVHLVDKHAAAAGESRLVEVERAHVAEDHNPGGMESSEAGGEILGEIEDRAYLVVGEELAGLFEVSRAVLDREFWGGFEFVDEAFALVAGSLLDDSDGEVIDVLLVVDIAEDERIDQRCEEENKEDRAVAEDAAHLDGENKPYIAEITYHFFRLLAVGYWLMAVGGVRGGAS